MKANSRARTGIALYNGHVREHARRHDIGVVTTPLRASLLSSMFVFVKFGGCKINHRFLIEELEAM